MPSIGPPARIALAFDSFTFGAYFGFARNVNCPATACSIPETPVISTSSPRSSHSNFAAISTNLMDLCLFSVATEVSGGVAGEPSDREQSQNDQGNHDVSHVLLPCKRKN